MLQLKTSLGSENKKLKEKKQELASRWEAVENQLNALDKEQREKLGTLTELNVDQLATRIRNKSTNPLELLHAFQAKVIQLHKENGNSGVCEFVREAENQARELTDNPYPVDKQSAIYGIPISVKELCAIKGYDSTFGLIKLVGQPKSEDCVVVRVLKASGAVPFVLTATSQLALTISGFNPVFGDLHNPASKNHEPGGSSTGEAVLLKQGGSPVGIGTDLLGSIRIPSAFCGLCGFKPTATRISSVGVVELDPLAVLPSIRVSVGPMGKRVADLVHIMEVLFDSQMSELDPTVPPIPFRRALYDGADRKSLVIGYYDTMNDPNIIQTVPSIRRAVRQAVEIAKRMGHRVVAFEPPRQLDALQLILRAVGPDGGQAALRMLENEPLNEYSRSIRLMVGVPDGLRGVVDATAKSSVGAPAMLAKMTQKLKSSQEAQEVMHQLAVYRREFLQALNKAGEIDVLLCPVFACPAYQKDTPAAYTNPPVIYTGLYNALDFPAGSIPMGKVTEDDIKVAKEWADDCQKNKDQYHQRLFTMQSESLGLPLAVQVVGKPYQDELVLRVMRELEAGYAAEHN